MASLTPTTLLYVLCGGVLPAVLWLWFWLREDLKKPEPRGLIVLSFFAGALGVIPALFLENYFRERANVDLTTLAIFGSSTGIILIAIWSFIEEGIKYLVAYIIDFHNEHFDEPIDSMIYLIAVALGFASFENALFIIKSIGTDSVTISATTIGMRFLGATLLHVLTSATLGGVIALAYCKGRFAKFFYTVLGIIAATLLHGLFNYFILSGGAGSTLIVFVALWICVICLLLFFEKVKKIVCTIKITK